MKEIYQELGIEEKVFQYGQQFEEKLKERFAQIDRTAEYNQLKVIKALQANKVSAEGFMGSSGYGYNDLGILWKMSMLLVLKVKRRWSALRSHVVPMHLPLR